LNAVKKLAEIINLTDEEVQGLAAKDKFRVDITPDFASLIDSSDPCCPIRRQVIPLGSWN
jgi:lysine 2,3-aminomutase